MEGESSKRRRLTNVTRACDPCRRMKSRCVGAEAPRSGVQVQVEQADELPAVDELERRCQRCSSLKLACTFELPQKKRGPPVRKHVDRPTTSSQSLAQPLPAAEEHSLPPMPAIPPTLSATPFELLAPSPSARTILSPGGVSSTGSPSSAAATASRRVTTGPHGHPTIIGRSTGVDLVAPPSWHWPQLEGTKEYSGSITTWPRSAPPLPPSILPPDRVVCDLVDLYMNHVHPLSAVLYVATFMRDLSNLLDIRRSRRLAAGTHQLEWEVYTTSSDGTTFVLLLLSVLSLASIYVRPKVGESDAETGKLHPGGKLSDELFGSAMALLALDPFNRTVESSDMQRKAMSMLILSQREMGCCCMRSSWSLVGAGIRLAQAANLSRDPALWAPFAKKMTHESVEEAKRIWSGLIFQEHLISSMNGTPSMIRFTEYDTPLPQVTEPDELLQWQPTLSTYKAVGDTGTSALQSRQIRSLSTSNAIATLATLAAEICSALSRPRAPGAAAVQEHVDLMQALAKWKAGLPLHLSLERGPSNEPALPHVLELHIFYEATLIQSWRPLLQDPMEEMDEVLKTLNLSPRGLCRTSARNITELVGLYSSAYGLRGTSWHMSFHILSALIVHLLDYIRPDGPSDGQPEACYWKCFEALIEMKDVWPSAGSSLRLVATLPSVEPPEVDLYTIADPPVNASWEDIYQELGGFGYASDLFYGGDSQFQLDTPAY